VHLNESTLLPAAWLARRFDVKVVWHLRTALLNDGLDRRSRFVVGVIDRTADAAIAIDQDVADRFRLCHAIDIVPNSTEIRPTDSVPSAAAKRALSLPEEVPAVGFFGYIRRQKGWPELVEAAQHLIAGGGQAQFVVMGGGVRGPRYFRTWRGWLLARLGLLVDEETDLHELVDQMDLANYFHFVPFATQTRAVYEALDIIVFPNQEVGLGRPVLEAAASARPVVASGSTSGAEVLVPGVTGLLVEAGDPVALAEAIGGLIGDPVRRREMGEAAFALARERFDPVRNARAVSLIYERLVETYVAAPAVEEEVLAR
jgi:glycosyltransferase involved in cell wall biosynthesis